MQARVRPDQESLTSLITQNFRQLCQDHLLYTQDIAIRGSLLFTIDSYDTYDIDVNEKVPLKRSGRGRQKKFPQQLSEIDESIIRDEVISRVTASSNDSPGSIPRKRGRPPKSASAMEVKPSTEENHSDDLVSRLSEVNDLNTPTTRKRRNCKSIYRTPDIPQSESATHSKESVDDSLHDTGSQMTSQNETKSPKSRSKVLPKKSKSPSAKIIDSEGETSITETVNQTLEVSEEGKHATGTGTSSSASDVNKSSVLEDGTGVEESMPQETGHDEAGKAGNEPDAENSDQPDAGPVTEAGEEGSIKVEKQEVEDVDPSLNDSQMKTDGQENIDQVLKPAQKKSLTMDEDDPEGQTSCDVCGKMFRRHINLVRHRSKCHRVRRKVDDIDRHECHVCNRKFPRVVLLQEHLKTAHADVTKCSICGKEINSILALQRHLVYHKDAKKYGCRECNKVFKRSGQLKVHMRTHSGEAPFICDICGYTCKQKSNLSMHYLQHTGAKPYTCKECFKSFAQKGTLALHFRTHTGEKPFICPTCGKSFTSISHRRVHERIHSNEAPYVCDICDRRFKIRGHLKRHKRHVHLEKPGGSLTQDGMVKSSMMINSTPHTLDMTQAIATGAPIVKLITSTGSSCVANVVEPGTTATPVMLRIPAQHDATKNSVRLLPKHLVSTAASQSGHVQTSLLHPTPIAVQSPSWLNKSRKEEMIVSNQFGMISPVQLYAPLQSVSKPISMVPKMDSRPDDSLSKQAVRPSEVAMPTSSATELVDMQKTNVGMKQLFSQQELHAQQALFELSEKKAEASDSMEKSQEVAEMVDSSETGQDGNHGNSDGLAGSEGTVAYSSQLHSFAEIVTQSEQGKEGAETDFVMDKTDTYIMTKVDSPDGDVTYIVMTDEDMSSQFEEQ